MKRLAFILLISFLLYPAQWLHLGPILYPQGGNAFLKFEPFSVETGRVQKLTPSFSLTWHEVSFPYVPEKKLPSLHYFVTYIKIPWGKRVVKIKGNLPMEIFLDGEKMGKGKEVKIERLFESGKHFLLVKVNYPGKGSIELKVEGNYLLSTSPQHNLSLREIMNCENISWGEVSSDGAYILVRKVKWDDKGSRKTWYEIWNLKTGKIVRSFKGFKITDFKWRPGSHEFSYIQKDSLYLSSLKGETKKLVESKDLRGYLWSKGGEFLVYFVYKKRREFNDFGLNLVKNPAFRQKGWGGKYKIYLLWPDTNFSVYIKTTESMPLSVNPDGKYLLLSYTYFDRKRRPYLLTKFQVLNLKTGEIKDVINDPWVNMASWSEDGKKLLLIGGPSSFSGLCSDLPRTTIPNDYDGQIIIYDLINKVPKCYTKNFPPSVISAFWSRNGRIIFNAEDKTYVRLYQLDTKNGRIEKLPVDGEVVRALRINDQGIISAIITGVNFPHRLEVLDKGKRIFTLFPAEKQYSEVRWGKVEDWDVKIGKYLVKGRIYYPPDFHPSEKYPLIIYYYGGTSPISRDFGGRYPKEWWASKGYVVYTLTPPGSTGFGQYYSSRHVNDWGKLSGKIIIKASERFIKEHPWVGKKGIIGASFGGFMTQYLVTKTNMFDAAVSHAGISMIPSYWGEGYWGYTYNAISAAFSFPWNRKDIYVERSPLFSADRIKTPLLLLHGTVDTNVPPGESHQMFTALEILGRKVSLVLVKGENHWIMGYKHRIGWYMAIMGWFDKYLKGDSTLWDSLFEEK